MRDLIALLLFAISGYFIFHARAETPTEQTSFELTPLPDEEVPDAAPDDDPEPAINI